MDTITYLDFDLLVERSEAGYRARVLSSPAGRATAEFILPFSELELENFLLRVGRTRRGVRRLESPEMKAARVFGVRLFEAAFDDEVRGRLRSSLNEANQRGVGLRIRLRLGDVPELADLPWEYLYDPTLDRFLSLSAETPVIRYLDLPQPIRPLTVEPPLRVLAMIASPSDYPSLDVDQEWAKLRDALSDLEQRRVVSLERLRKATLATLQRQLRRKEYHIFHFIGHGGFDQQAQDGILLLEAEGGQGRPVSGRYLGTLLHDHRSLRMAILNACEGARSSRSDPFAGTAQSLVQQGIPAVIAMQFEITDEAAITLAHEFYAALADGYSVDAALAEARKAIFARGNDVEWGTPVLYTRLPDGRIFDVTQARAVQPPIPAGPPAFDEELEQRLEQLYTDGLSAFWLEEWEKACRSFQAIVDARPDYQDAAPRLEEAQRQWRLNALYDQAQAAVEAEAWQGALSALEELAAEAADFKDVAALLETTKKHKQLADLYAQAHYLYQARRWQAVVNVFAQIATIEPDYPDPENLLPTAEQELAELKRQAELSDLYSRAVREMDAGHWQGARQLFVRVQEMEPGFRQTERLLARVEAKIAHQEAKRQQQEQIATLYEQAQGLAHTGQWQQALSKIQEIQGLDPDFSDPEGIAARAQEEIERQRRLNALYGQAQAAREAADWQGALSALEELVAEAPNYKDAAALLEATQKQGRLADLYDEAQRLCRTGQWQAVVDAFAQIHAIEPGYPDPEKLLPAAKQEIAAQERQAQLNDLYGRAVREMEAGRWQGARQLLTQVQEIKQDFRETERLLARAEAEIKREKAERQRQEQVATLYEQAQGLARAHQWRQALAKMEEIQTLDPQFADPEGIAARAQTETAKEEQEARRQGELAALYAEAVRLLRVGQYQEALEKWREVQDRDPRYPDRKKVQATARKKLAALAKSKQPKRGLPRWAVFAIGGIAVVAFALVGVLLSLGPGGTPEVTPTRIRIPTNTSRPPTPTPALSPPSPVSALLSNAKVLYYDDFDQLSSTQWYYTDGYVQASGGLAEITGTSDWAAFLTSRWSLNEGECVVVLFKYNADAELVILLDHGEWGTSSYKRWGIYFWGNEFEPNVWKGETQDPSNELEGDLTIEPDKWYYLLLAVTRDAEFVAQIWERDDPTHKSECRRAFDGSWAGLTWSFCVDANSGKVYVDDFTVISFSEILGSGAGRHIAFTSHAASIIPHLEPLRH